LGNAITEPLHTPSAGQALLRITVISARDLLAMDAGGTSDPYCEMMTEPGRIKENHKRTPTQMKTLNPYWNHTFELDVTGLVGIGVVHFRMMDYDWGSSDDLIGTLDLKLMHLSNGKLKQKWYPLQGPALKKPLTGFAHAGEVELRTQVRATHAQLTCSSTIGPVYTHACIVLPSCVSRSRMIPFCLLLTHTPILSFAHA
jgi:hypothetical protein